jgi:hypothetical protein
MLTFAHESASRCAALRRSPRASTSSTAPRVAKAACLTSTRVCLAPSPPPPLRRSARPAEVLLCMLSPAEYTKYKRSALAWQRERGAAVPVTHKCALRPSGGWCTPWWTPPSSGHGARLLAALGRRGETGTVRAEAESARAAWWAASPSWCPASAASCGGESCAREKQRNQRCPVRGSLASRASRTATGPRPVRTPRVSTRFCRRSALRLVGDLSPWHAQPSLSASRRMSTRSR